MKTHIILFFLCLSAFACGPDRGKTPPPETLIQVFQNADKSWGYDISLRGKPYVHQPHKPAVGGMSGFASENQARKVAELVAYKIRNGILPPSVSRTEVDSLIRVADQ